MTLVAQIAAVTAILAAVATGATAATFQTAYSFSGKNGSGGSGLTLAKNGLLYGFGVLSGGSNVFKFNPATSVFKTMGNIEGDTPLGSPALDSKGDVFGVQTNGGQGCSNGCGLIFGMSPTGGPATTLYQFHGAEDGSYPSAGLIIDAKGLLYGTTLMGGTSTACAGGCGTVFKFDPTALILTTLYVFPGTQGIYPNSTLLLDKNGFLYGTTEYSANKCGCGTVFKLNPSTGALTTLFAFTELKDGSYPNGAFPSGGLTMDSNSELYGTTAEGGGAGTVFQLNPSTKKITTLYSFTTQGTGLLPYGVLPNGAGTTLYGVTGEGGIANPKLCQYGCGTVYQLTPPLPGQTSWVLTTLHDFAAGADGWSPAGPLIFDSMGALDATTYAGGLEIGSPYCCGTIFKETP